MATNPYESPSAASSRTVPLAHWILPSLLCALVTVLTFPLSSVAVVWLWTIDKPLDSPAGLIFYLGMCVRASIIILPLNSLVIAPMLYRIGGKTHIRRILLHVAVGLAGALGVWLWPGMLSSMPFPVWALMAYYLVQLLGPPMLAGSLAYSLYRRFREGEVPGNR